MSRSQILGVNTSETEVVNISSHGIWLYTHGREYFISYEDFPWFKDGSVNEIVNVREPSPGNYYWPDLDIDLGIETIKNPQRFPLISHQA